MHSEHSSVVFEDEKGDATHRTENSSITFEVGQSQPQTINARTEGNATAPSESVESIQFERVSQPPTINPRGDDKPSVNSSIAFEVGQSQPQTINARAESNTTASEEIHFKVEDSIPTAARTHESLEFQVLDDAKPSSGAEDTVLQGDAEGEKDEFPVPLNPPPRRLSQRAAAAAGTPRGDGKPLTPRMRSPTSSFRPQQSEDVYPLEDEPNPNNATLPPGAQAPEAFSDAGDEGMEAVPADLAAKVAPPLPVPSAATMIVTTHTKHFDGDQWADVVTHSRDTLERTITNETAQALDMDPQFLRVLDVTASKDGLTAEISVVHDPVAMPEAEVSAKIEDHPYGSTSLLHDIRTVRGTHQVYGLAAALQNAEANDAEHPDNVADAKEDLPAHSFTTMVGQGGMLLIDYQVPSTGEASHLELFVDGAAASMKGRYIKQFVSEHVKAPVAELAVRFAGSEVADDTTGADLGWVNGSVIDVVRTPQASAADAALATEKKGEAATKGSPKKKKKTGAVANGKAANKAEGGETKVTKKKKAAKKSTDGAAAAKSTKATTKAKAKGKGKGKKGAKKGKAATATTAAERTGRSQSRERSVKMHRSTASAPPPHYLATTQSHAEHSTTLTRPLPETLTTPRVFCPRTPRAGAERRPYLAMQYTNQPLVIEGAEPIPQAPGRRSRGQSSTRGASQPVQSKARSASVASRATDVSAATSEGRQRTPIPPQRVTRAVRPTTPRSNVRPVIYSAKSENVAGGTPSVSRRSHSPHRTPPTQHLQQPPSYSSQQNSVNRYENPGASSAPVAYHPYMDLEQPTPQSQLPEERQQSQGYEDILPGVRNDSDEVDYRMEYEIECMGEPAATGVTVDGAGDGARYEVGVVYGEDAEPVPAGSAPNPFV